VEDAEIEPEENTPTVIGSNGIVSKKLSFLKRLKNADQDVFKPLLIYNYK
jgi:hypothetical protein